MSLKNQVKVISFYTLNSSYEQEVLQLSHSCELFKIPLEVDSLPCQGSWEKNVALKPLFILQKLQKSKTPLLWVDADAVFLQKPDFTPFLGGDFAVRSMQIFEDRPEYALCAGTLFMNTTKEGIALVEKWAQRCLELSQGETPPFVDQISLYQVILENKGVNVLALPISYCKIFDIDTFFIDDDQVVIEHRQASRRVRV